MMFRFSEEINAGKIGAVAELIRSELGVTAHTFRAGRWGFGPTVAAALRSNGIVIDSSVSPLINWKLERGANYSDAPLLPYRFDPEDPLEPVPNGSMVQLPTTIGFLSGDSRKRGQLRDRLEESLLAKAKVVGILDRLGVLARRWLSPEGTSPEDMIALVDSCARQGNTTLQMTFHSCTLLPGATPFVHTDADQENFFAAIDAVLTHVSERGYRFATLKEVGEAF